MRLTNSIKDAIIAAVMQDTPEAFTYDQYFDAALKIAVDKMPDKVRAVWDDKNLRSFVHTKHYNGIYLPILDNSISIQKIDELCEKYKTSERERRELRSHVRKVVYQFSTDKQMRELIPELDKYIPKQAAKVAQLPASNNLIADLVKAGWPKPEVIK